MHEAAQGVFGRARRKDAWLRGLLMVLFLLLKWKDRVELERTLGRARALGEAQALG